MNTASVPNGLWTWRRSAVVIVIVLLPVAALTVTASSGTARLTTAALDAMVVWPAALAAAVAAYAAWWLHPRQGIAWATIGLAALGSQELVRAAVQVVSRDPVPGLRLLVSDLSAVLAVVLTVVVAHRHGRHPDPAAVGFGLGALLAGWRVVLIQVDLGVGELLSATLVGLGYLAMLLLVAGLLAWGGGLTPRLGSIPPWARHRTALALVAVGTAHCTASVADSVAARVVVVVGDTIGAVLLVSTYAALLVGDVRSTHQSYSNLNDELVRARRRHQVSRAQIHEINATIVGITTASELLRSSARPLSRRRRRSLEDMVAAELGRLERLVDDSVRSGTSRLTDLDDVIGPLVVSQEVRGRHVRWTPSGLRAVGRSDVVGEIVNVLLSNAANHGESGVEISAVVRDGLVEVEVHDDGPGVDPALRDRIFEWEVRGPRSTGQGLGLHIARDLAQQQGGYLRLAPSRWGGATFVLGLPLPPPVPVSGPADGDGPRAAASTERPGVTTASSD